MKPGKSPEIANAKQIANGGVVANGQVARFDHVS